MRRDGDRLDRFWHAGSLVANSLKYSEALVHSAVWHAGQGVAALNAVQVGRSGEWVDKLDSWLSKPSARGGITRYLV